MINKPSAGATQASPQGSRSSRSNGARTVLPKITKATRVCFTSRTLETRCNIKAEASDAQPRHVLPHVTAVAAIIQARTSTMPQARSTYS